MLLKNKIALVTGASRGIGRGIALSLAKEGCSVIISDIDEVELKNVEREISLLGVRVLLIKCDVSQKDQVNEMMQKVQEIFGKLDILVNNAGIYPHKSFEEITEGDWDRVISVNLKSIFLCSQEALKIMPNGGRIINISSIASFVGFNGLTHYCASKGALNSMIRALALEVASRKITVNAIAPGVIETPGAHNPDKNLENQTISMIPLARMGQVEDIAWAVVFLASDLSSYITGQTIIVDGGWTLR
ncbi:MAG: SDR family NAD(P)-dependent oxidoreductase [Patescibacteria group bacterium]|nr:SDR family NAD(P)-dependent oxidoreductase [Patescibacteria group bacterium]